MHDPSSPSGATRRYRGCGQEVGVVFRRADNAQDHKNQKNHFSLCPIEKSLRFNSSTEKIIKKKRFNSSNGITKYSINELGMFVSNNSKLSR